MEDRVRITADDSDYTNVMRRAGNTADQFTGRIERASRGFTQLFRRTPERRAELALTGLTTSLVSGDLAGAVASFAHRMSGLGLVAGVAVGGAALVFEKFHKQIKETREAHEALRQEMVKRPLGTVTSLPAEGMEQALQTREKLAEEFINKSQKTLGSEIWAGLQATPGTLFGDDPGFASNKPRPIEKSEQERIQAQKDLNKQITEGKQIMEAQAALANTMLGIRRMELSGDERQAEIAKIILNAEQQRAALKSRGITAKAFARQDEIISENANLSIREVEKKTAAKEMQLKFEEKIAKIQRDGLAGDDLKKARVAFEIQDLKERIATEPNSMTRRELKVQRMEKENELRILAPRAPERNAFPFGTPSSRAFENEFGQGGFARRQIEDSLGFGGLARRSIDRGESLTPEEALLNTRSSSAQQIAEFKKNVGELPGGETGNAAVVAILTELKRITAEAWSSK